MARGEATAKRIDGKGNVVLHCDCCGEDGSTPGDGEGSHQWHSIALGVIAFVGRNGKVAALCATCVRAAVASWAKAGRKVAAAAADAVTEAQDASAPGEAPPLDVG